MTDTISPTTPLLLSAQATADMLGVSLRTLRAMDASGRIPAPRRLGRMTRWSADELRDWVDAGCPDRRTWLDMRQAR